MLPIHLPIWSQNRYCYSNVSASWCPFSQSPSQASPISCLTARRTALWNWVSSRLSWRRGNRLFPFRFFLKWQQSRELCVVHVPPCLLQGCRVSRYKLSGTVVITRLLRTYFIAVRRFLVARSDGRFGSYLATLLAVQGFLVARCVGLIGYFLATYGLGSLERQKERTHVHRSPTFLVKVNLILPRVRAS